MRATGWWITLALLLWAASGSVFGTVVFLVWLGLSLLVLSIAAAGRMRS